MPLTAILVSNQSLQQNQQLLPGGLTLTVLLLSSTSLFQKKRVEPIERQ
jgi:hypothetical protein